MAFSLTVDGYTFENPPEEYRKLIRLGNSDQTAFNRNSASFYQSNSQDLQLQLKGTLALDPALGGTDDLTELSDIQQIAIEGGEVDVDFDPFFSGKAVIEDNPFRQAEGEGTYDFTFTVNTDSTDASAYPAHSAPDTGNTFTLGDLDLGYDPNSVTQEYERQTEKVQRLQGIARTVDTKGLVPKVTLSGFIDGGGQDTLWDKARSNVMAYLSAEFQNGWCLIDSLSIRNAAETPHYLEGMFRYDLDVLIVADPGSGIGEVSKFVDREVSDNTEYVSNCDTDGIFERLGDDSESYPQALDYRVTGGTGKLAGEYLEWGEDFGTLSQSATNHIYIEDPDDDGYGNVAVSTSGFPGDTLALFEVDTSTSSVTDIRDVRSCLMGERLEGDAKGDLNFTTNLALDDSQFAYDRLLALADTLALSHGALTPGTGLATMDPETLSLSTNAPNFPWESIARLSESINLIDGGSAVIGGPSGTEVWETSTDWDNAVSKTGMAHESVSDTDHTDAALLKKGYQYSSIPASVQHYFPFHEASGASTFTDLVGSAGGSINGTAPGVTGILGSTAHSFDGSNDYNRMGASASGQIHGLEFWFKPDSVIDGSGSFEMLFSDASSTGRYVVIRQFNSGLSGETLSIHFNGDTFITNTIDAVWNWVFFAWNGSSYDIWLNGVKKTVSSGSSHANILPADVYDIGARQANGDGYYAGDIAEMVLYDSKPSDAFIQARYEVFSNASTLTTATKSFSGPANPDLVGLDYTLNGGSITLDVIGSPGTGGEETVQQVLSGATSYALNWASSHQDFRVKISASTTDETTTPTLNSISLEAQGTGGAEGDQNQKTTWEIQGALYDTGGNEYEGGGVISRYGA